MPTYLDESGDAGIGEKSAPFFRLAAVWFERPEDAEACRREIARVRSDIKMPETFEFKFARIGPDQRTAFLAAVAGHPFHFAVCSVEKRSRRWGTATEELSRDAIYRTAAGAVATALHEYYLIAEECKGTPLGERVVADYTTDPLYFRHVRAGFQSLKSVRKPGTSLVKSVKPGKSHVDGLIQLADMVCGAVGRSLDGSGEYEGLLTGKKIGVVVVP